jgi:hypothetical protein
MYPKVSQRHFVDMVSSICTAVSQGLRDATGRSVGGQRACAACAGRACERCVLGVRQRTCSRCMPTWISAPRAGRGSSDPLQPFWSCPRLTCGDGDPMEEEMGS